MNYPALNMLVREHQLAIKRRVITPFGPATCVSHGDATVLMDVNEYGERQGIRINGVEYAFRFDTRYNPNTGNHELVDGYVYLCRVGSFKVCDYTRAAMTNVRSLVGWLDTYLKANPDFIAKGKRVYVSNQIITASVDYAKAKAAAEAAHNELEKLLILEADMESCKEGPDTDDGVTCSECNGKDGAHYVGCR